MGNTQTAVVHAMRFLILRVKLRTRITTIDSKCTTYSAFHRHNKTTIVFLESRLLFWARTRDCKILKYKYINKFKVYLFNKQNIFISTKFFYISLLTSFMQKLDGGEKFWKKITLFNYLWDIRKKEHTHKKKHFNKLKTLFLSY